MKEDDKYIIIDTYNNKIFRKPGIGSSINYIFSKLKKSIEEKKVAALHAKLMTDLQAKRRTDKHSQAILDLFNYTADINFNEGNKCNVLVLLELANNKYPNASVDEKKKIDNLMNAVLAFLKEPNLGHEHLLFYCEQLDSQFCPYWLKVIIGIVLLIVAVTLLLSAIALVISLTGGGAAAFIAPAVALAKPLIDIVAGISIASVTVGTSLATGALAGAGFAGAAATGGLSFFFMHKPYTDCVKEIIKEELNDFWDKRQKKYS